MDLVVDGLVVEGLDARELDGLVDLSELVDLTTWGFPAWG